MPLELKNVTKRVGAEVYIHETNLVIEEGTSTSFSEARSPARRP